MSTKSKARTTESGHAQAITRSFDDKPTLVNVIRQDGPVTYVGSLKTQRITGFPAWEVFAYDAELFSELERAFNGGSCDKLRQLWAEAEQFGG